MAQQPRPPRLRQDPETVVRKRTEKGLNQKQLAARVGISAAHMCRIETGNSGASARVLYRLAEIFDCKVAELLPAPQEAGQR